MTDGRELLARIVAGDWPAEAVAQAFGRRVLGELLECFDPGTQATARAALRAVEGGPRYQAALLALLDDLVPDAAAPGEQERAS